jgi:Mce-associated membrane protein
LTAVLQEAETESVTEQVETNSVASWPSRAGAFAVDVLFGLAVFAVLVLAWFTAPLYGCGGCRSSSVGWSFY